VHAFFCLFKTAFYLLLLLASLQRFVVSTNTTAVFYTLSNGWKERSRL